jgi:hypothetical protein
MFFTINLHSRIFGLGESKHRKDPSDTNLGSRIKAALFRQDVRNPPFAGPIGFFNTATHGKTKVLIGLFTLARFDLFSTTTAYPREG